MPIDKSIDYSAITPEIRAKMAASKAAKSAQ